MDIVGKAKEVNQQELVGGPSPAYGESRASGSEGKLCGAAVKAVDVEKVIPPPGEQLSLNPVAAFRDKQYDKSACQYQITESDNGITGSVDVNSVKPIPADSDADLATAAGQLSLSADSSPGKLNKSGIIDADPILKETNEKTDGLEGSCYNDAHIFRIENFAKRRADAAKGIETYVDSVPFYTGEKGYKLCTRFYPNGATLGEGTHISIGICLMKGKHDDTLPWPFTANKVSFILVSQTNRVHIADAFKPATYFGFNPDLADFIPTPEEFLSSGRPCQTFKIPQTPRDLAPFQKPQNSDKNLCANIPLFVSNDELDDESMHYLDNDTCVVKTVVDMTS